MGKNRSMTLEQRYRSLSMLEAGMAVTHAPRNIGVSHCTISRLWTNINAPWSLKDRPRTSRPRKTTANEDRYITQQISSIQRQEQLFNTLLLVNHRLVLFHSEHLLKIYYTTIYPCLTYFHSICRSTVAQNFVLNANSLVVFLCLFL